MVDFGRQRRFGYVVETLPAEISPEIEVKPLDLNQEIFHCFEPWQLEFFYWIARYYGDSVTRVIDTAVPQPAPAKFERYAIFIQDPPRPLRGKVQRELLLALKEGGGPVLCSELQKRFPGALQVLRALQSAGLAKIESREQSAEISGMTAPDWAKREVELDEHQKSALQQVSAAVVAGSFAPFLLHGVTGSGKTEVYIDAIAAAREAGRGALIIVPEIALTPQLIDRFVARLGSSIAVLHSGIARRERWSAWRALIEKKSFIALGARSAIFAPVPDLGLIIVDEEHDGSYKQAEGLRYNARDLAVVLAKMKSCPVVLGSATPSLESYYNAATKKYSYLHLPQRHGTGNGVDIKLIDLNKCKPWEQPSKHISLELYEALKEVLERDQQAFILYNRRGFAAYLQCERCHAVLNCPNCSVTLTFHAAVNRLKCHYCDYEAVVLQKCPYCGQQDEKGEPGDLAQRGAGTEKVFDEIQELFPGVGVARLDRDSVSQLWKYRRILDDVRSGKTKILVGTQMIAKGHDLPGVTLVGIVDCDVGLHMPDFRAGERIFQLLTQAAGRSGRGDQRGKVILQTRVPQHPSLIKTVEQDYKGFAKIELLQRKEAGYPPFSRMLRVVASAEDQQAPPAFLLGLREKALNRINGSALPVVVLGPSAAPLGRLRNRWRWHLLFKAKTITALGSVLNELQRHAVPKKIRLAFDLDPQDLL